MKADNWLIFQSYYNSRQLFSRNCDNNYMTGSFQKMGFPSAARLHPGGWSMSGFTAPSEDAAEIIETDRQTLDELDITREQIVKAMERTIAIKSNPLAINIEARGILLRKFKSWKKEPSAEALELAQQYPDLAYGFMDYWRLDKFIVGTRLYLTGNQPCPFGCDAGTVGDLFVLNQETNHSMFFSGLMPHLIGEHGFFEGHVLYRVDPIHAALVFGLPTQYTVAKLNQLWQEKLARLSKSSDPVIRDFATYHQKGNYLEQQHKLFPGTPSTVKLKPGDKDPRIRALLFKRRK